MLATLTRPDPDRPRSRRPDAVALVLVAVAIAAIVFTVARLVTAGDGGPAVAELTATEVPAEIRAQWPAWAELEPIAPGQWRIPGTDDVFVSWCGIPLTGFDRPLVNEVVFVTVSAGQDCSTFIAGEP